MSAAAPPPDGVWTKGLLLAAEVEGLALDSLLFYGHTPPPSGAIGPHVLSQWWIAPFEHEGHDYPSAEHFMMAEKARLFGDKYHLEQILAADGPRRAKALGRRVRGFDNDVWNEHRLEIVTRGSIAKFGAGSDMTAYLLGTGSRVLVEASPRDRIWGIGIGRNNPDARYPSRWRGRNLLGLALMRARAELASRST